MHLTPDSRSAVNCNTVSVGKKMHVNNDTFCCEAEKLQVQICRSNLRKKHSCPSRPSLVACASPPAIVQRLGTARVCRKLIVGIRFPCHRSAVLADVLVLNDGVRRKVHGD